MSEQNQPQPDSPLVSERGTTTINDSIVSTIAGMAAQEVEGVYMGGSAARAASGILGSITGSESQTRGVSAEVGTVETAIDLTMGIEYGRDILPTVDEVRRRISDRVQSITGLRVTELNVTISDVIFPEEERGRRRAPEGSTEAEPRELPRRELRPGAAEREVTEVTPRSRTHTEGASGPVPEEEVRVEGEPLRGDRPGAAERETTDVTPRIRTRADLETGPVPEEEVRVEGEPLQGDETAELRPEDVSETRRTPEEGETSRGEER